MPTYVYRREDGSTFELFQRMTDDALDTCPTTGQSVQRIIGGGAGLIFKGSGFYQTDYAKAAGKAEDKAEPKTGTAEAKTEAAPKTKVENKSEA